MFNRNNLPSLSSPFGQRPDSSPRPQPRDGYGRIDQQAPPPRQGGYDTRMTGGYDDRSMHGSGREYQNAQRLPVGGRPPSGQRPPPQPAGDRPMQLRPAKSMGGNKFAFGNLVALSTRDFSDRSPFYIMVNGGYAFLAVAIDQQEPGEIGLTDPQRSWASVSLGPNEVVTVERFKPTSDTFLGSMLVEVAFAGRKIIEAPYDQDELAKYFKNNFKDQILAPEQQLLLDVRSIPLRLTIKNVSLIDISYSEKATSAPSRDDKDARGILTAETVIDFFKDSRSPIQLKASRRRPAANSIIQPTFKFEDMGIGGLDEEFSQIFRRAFASRIFPPGLIQDLGIIHVKGMLLYGPPGTGKTLIARQIGKMLNAREPKVINGPEVLNKYVGQSEENIRKLFAEAEKEYKEKGDESGLHIIIFDELDAVCKQRGSGAGGGTGVGDSVVNQLLSKLDGVDQLNNILLIGMTNRKDMIDEALLRSGRLEIQLEIGLPDENGRQQILAIHTTTMRKSNKLDADVDLTELAKMTKNFSGAEITGLVRSATSFALSRHIKTGTKADVAPDVDQIKVRRSDFMQALDEVKPLFGVSEEELGRCIDGGIMHFSSAIESILKEGKQYVSEMRKPDVQYPVKKVCLFGPRGSGKTALAAKMALDSGFPFIKLIAPQDMVGFNDMMKVQHMEKIFRDAFKSPFSVIVLDNIEGLIDWVPIGPRFSSTVLSNLKHLLNSKPPKDRRLLVFATTSEHTVLQDLKLDDFDYEIPVPNVNTQEELAHILQESGVLTEQDQRSAISQIQDMTGGRQIGVGVRKILTAIQTAREDRDPAGRLAQIISRAISSRGFV